MSTSKKENVAWNCAIEVSAILCEDYANEMEEQVANLLNSEIRFSVKTKAQFARRLAEKIRGLKYENESNG